MDKIIVKSGKRGKRIALFRQRTHLGIRYAAIAVLRAIQERKRER